jgi:Cu-Zn family superoxide dismutase
MFFLSVNSKGIIMRNFIKYWISFIFFVATSSAFADMTIPMYMTAAQGTGPLAGNIVIQETPHGLLFTPHLQGLTPGIHGFHIHVNASCAEEGMAAGGHLDPDKSNHHLGPYNDKGHLGDLPALYVNADGSVTLPVLAPRLKHLSMIKNHALMIHNGGDNYSDEPIKLGGGGARMICGLIL